MSISIQNRQDKIKVDLARLRRSLKTLLAAMNHQAGELSLVLVDDAQIRETNRTYLERDRPTNVISFSMKEGEFGHINPNVLGDIVISVETASRDAQAGNIDFMDEMEFLLIHGLLHLLGYNHEEVGPDKSREMKDKEQELFYRLRQYHTA
ncbi:MAG: rRNA maturation RNase YbeY [Deltaproteobacteria bacterium]|nr:rRNA maturation RNase YbeY [Deltaproteobacteria bacterium]